MPTNVGDHKTRARVGATPCLVSVERRAAAAGRQAGAAGLRGAAAVRRVPAGVQHRAFARRVRRDSPASRYAGSRRPYPERLPPPEYPGHFLVKRVTDAGTSRFQQRLLFNTALIATLGERDVIIRG